MSDLRRLPAGRHAARWHAKPTARCRSPDRQRAIGLRMDSESPDAGNAHQGPFGLKSREIRGGRSGRCRAGSNQPCAASWPRRVFQDSIRSGSPSRRGPERPGRVARRADCGGRRPGSPCAAARSVGPRPARPQGGAGAGRTGQRTRRGPAGRRDRQEGRPGVVTSLASSWTSPVTGTTLTSPSWSMPVTVTRSEPDRPDAVSGQAHHGPADVPLQQATVTVTGKPEQKPGRRVLAQARRLPLVRHVAGWMRSAISTVEQAVIRHLPGVLALPQRHPERPLVLDELLEVSLAYQL